MQRSTHRFSKSVVYWTECVVRNKGASHLTFPAANMPLYQYLQLDVSAFIVAMFIICSCIVLRGKMCCKDILCTSIGKQNLLTEEKLKRNYY